MTYEEIMLEAEKAGLIIYAYGGVAILATHEEQKEREIFEHTQYKCGLRKHPKTLEV